MKNSLYFLLSISAAIALNMGSPATAQAQWIFKRDGVNSQKKVKKSRKQLLIENAKISAELDSLKNLLEAYKYNDSIRSEIIEILEENEDVKKDEL